MAIDYSERCVVWNLCKAPHKFGAPLLQLRFVVRQLRLRPPTVKKKRVWRKPQQILQVHLRFPGGDYGGSGAGKKPKKAFYLSRLLEPKARFKHTSDLEPIEFSIFVGALSAIVSKGLQQIRNFTIASYE